MVKNALSAAQMIKEIFVLLDLDASNVPEVLELWSCKRLATGCPPVAQAKKDNNLPDCFLELDRHSLSEP